MHSIRLISAILRGKWLVEPNFAISQGSLIASILNNNLQVEEQKPDPLSAFAVSARDVTGVKYSWYSGFDKAPKNSIAIISIKGALMKDDQFCGPMGMATIGRIINQADNHHNIDGIVLHIDSPGGTVDGTETLAGIVKNAKKPIVSFVDGLMASAALWIGSSADEVMASTDTDEVGSVGVLMSFADIQPYWEKKGIKFHTITASTSPEKVKLWEDLRDGKYEQYIKEVLDPLDEKFMNAVKQNRSGVEEKHLTGKVFFARDVMGIFVDRTGSLEDAILRASELATERKENSNNSQNTFSMKQFEKLNAVLGVESLEAVDDQISLNQEQLESVEAALSSGDQLEAERDTAVTERDTAVAERDTARTDLADAVGMFDAIDPSIANAQTPQEKAEAVRALLAAKPGSKIEGNHDTHDPEGGKPKDADWDVIDSLPHNKSVDQNS